MKEKLILFTFLTIFSLITTPIIKNNSLIIPTNNELITYQVQKGDSLWDIALKYDSNDIENNIKILPIDKIPKKIVMKFGGSSISNSNRMLYVAKLIKKYIDYGYKPIIVLSAIGKTTNNLLLTGNYALNEGTILIDNLKEIYDNLISNNIRVKLDTRNEKINYKVGGRRKGDLKSAYSEYACTKASPANLLAPYIDVCLKNEDSGVGNISGSPYTVALLAKTKCLQLLVFA